ncbi:hypothetical protein D0Z07_6441 [Hyphodiscus hymeniophilus]|uniref:C2H2-type domain-containing protein n=1 Tax=Hyphodiscus hymeniophilus TaxID=353542 RepID=A0A9P6VFK0_9HELO|nr:hypothetical protein D0Z07_6441 [Hyphodiscus hymeniophilus]
MCSLPTILPSDADAHHAQYEGLKPYLIILDNPVGLPICLKCQNAILPRSLMDHLRKQHDLPVDLRAAVRQLVSTLPPLDISDLPLQPNGSVALSELRVVESFQCRHCPFIRRDVTDVRKHLNKEHSLSAAGNYEQIQAQSWLGGKRAVYWRVKVPVVSVGFGVKAPVKWPRELGEKKEQEVP